MNFVELILNNGFVEQGQKKLFDITNNNYIPKWWNNYPFNEGYFGLKADNPDAWFVNSAKTKQVLLSLQGSIVGGLPMDELSKAIHQYRELFNDKSIKYICLKVGADKFYETFTGNIPSEHIVTEFLQK